MLEFISKSRTNTASREADLKQTDNQNTFAIIKVVEALAHSTTEKDTLLAALDTVKSSFGWAYGSYWFLDKDSNTLQFKVDSGTVNPEFQMVTQSATFKEGVGLNGKAWQSRELIFVQDLDTVTDCCRREPAQKAGVKSGICFPIIVQGEVVGTMDFFSTATLNPSTERLDVLKSIGRLISSALEQIQNQARHQENMQNCEAISQILQMLLKADSEIEAARIALDTVKSSFGWAYGSYWFLDKDSNTLQFKVDSGTVNPEFQMVTQSATFKEGVGLNGKAWQSRELIFVQDLGTITDCCRREPAQKAGVKSGICFPIIVQGEVVGTMDFFSTATLNPSTERLEALRTVGGLVSFSLERIQKIQSEQQTMVQIKQCSTELTQFSDALKTTGESIFETSENSANQAQEVATEAGEANENIQMLVSSISQMSSSIQEISHNAQQASQITQNAELKAEESKKIMDVLGCSAQEINSVVDLIKDIASQTNLLALNATIEAASAGEAGKGFAVVANEVKALAKQSAEATDNIRTRVETIQQNTQDAMKAIELIAQTIMDINDIIRNIASAVEEQSVTASEISHTVSGTATSIETISKNIVHLVQMSRETSDSATSIEQLNKMLDNLRGLIRGNSND